MVTNGNFITVRKDSTPSSSFTFFAIRDEKTQEGYAKLYNFHNETPLFQVFCSNADRNLES